MPANHQPIPKGQVTLRQLLEALAWISLAFAYAGFLFNRSDANDFHYEGYFYSMLAPPIILGPVGAAIGCLLGARLKGVLIGLTVGIVYTFLMF